MWVLNDADLNMILRQLQPMFVPTFTKIYTITKHFFIGLFDTYFTDKQIRFRQPTLTTEEIPVKTTLVTLIVISSLTLSLIFIMQRAHAHEASPHHGDLFSSAFPLEKRMDRMAKFLELNPEQQSALETLWQNQRNEMKSERQTMHASRQAFHEAITSTHYDAAQIERLANELSTQMSTMLVAHANNFRQMYELLTPEQQTKFLQLNEKRLDHKKRRFMKHHN